MEELIETWHINNRANLRLLGDLTPEQLATPLTKGKTVGGQFSHIHRAHVELALRQAGLAVTDKTAYALWEWGVL